VGIFQRGGHLEGARAKFASAAADHERGEPAAINSANFAMARVH
jgi:hypothetical protein